MLDKTNICVEFAIYGDRFDPNKITEILKVTPTKTHIKGEPTRSRYHLYKETLWEYATGYQESYDIKDQIKVIYDIFKDKIDLLNKIRIENAVNIIIWIVINVENDEKPDMRLEPWFIDFLHEIHADIDFDIYFLS